MAIPIKNARDLILQASAARTIVNTVSLDTTNSMFKLPKNGSLISPTSITLTATSQNYTAPIYTWYYATSTSPSTYTPFGTNSATQIISSELYTTHRGLGSFVLYKVEVSQLYKDTSYAIQQIGYDPESLDAINIYVSRPSVVVPADSSGIVSVYSNTGLFITVKRGLTDLTYATSGSNTFSISSTVVSPVGSVTLGTSSNDSTTYTLSDITAMSNTEDTAKVTLTIDIRDADGILISPSATVTQVLTKLKQGSPGTRTAILDMYKLGVSAPTPYPVGTSTYTWATGQFTAPDTPNGWSLVPPTPIVGQTLWIARTVYADSSTSATTNVTWDASTALPVGSSGVNGQRIGFLEVYKWAASMPTSYPSGTSTYTWATGQFTAPTTANGWSVVPGAATAGYTLWAISVNISDNLTTATSEATWNSSTVYAIGAAGINGSSGSDGLRGSQTFYDNTLVSAAWSDAKADAKILAVTGSYTKIVGDTMVQTYGTSWTLTKYWNGGSWIAPGTVIDGSLLVTGSVSANAVDTRNLTIKDSSGTTVFSAGVPLASTYIASVTGNQISGGTIDSDVRMVASNQVSTGAAAFNGVTFSTSYPGVHANGRFSTGYGLQITGLVTIDNSTKVTNLNADYIDGYDAGNSSGQVAVSNGTQCTNLYAQYSSSLKATGNTFQLKNGRSSGSQTPTAIPANKPGSTSGTVSWLTINIDGTDYYVPSWTD